MIAERGERLDSQVVACAYQHRQRLQQIEPAAVDVAAAEQPGHAVWTGPRLVAVVEGQGQANEMTRV